MIFLLIVAGVSVGSYFAIPQVKAFVDEKVADIRDALN